MPFRHLPWLFFLSFMGAGCLMSTSRQVTDEVSAIAARCGEGSLPRGSDLLPPSAPAVNASLPKSVASLAEPPKSPSSPLSPLGRGAGGDGTSFAKANDSPAEPEPVVRLSYVQREILVPRKKFRLEVPRELPGANAPPIQNMPVGEVERKKYLDHLFPSIPPLPPECPPAPGPEGRPITLGDLQHYAETYSPAVKSAEAAVMAARGGAYGAGQYPNPTVGFEYDTVQTIGGYPGGYMDQLIKTGGKLTVAQASAVMDLLNAKLALRRAKSDARYQVRGYYFAVLVARENARVSDALFRFAEEIYRAQVSIVSGGFGAAYEPMQLRPLVLQAQLNVIQARNMYLASWRQLAAAIGLPNMCPSELEGSVDMPIPTFDYCEVLKRLENHTDVLTAYVSIQKAKYDLRTQELVNMPDIDVRMVIQKDYTATPSQIANSSVMSAVIPLWYQNQGGIRQAQWLLAQAAVGPAQARNALIVILADAFNRYQTMQRTVQIVNEQIQDQVRVYRSLYDRRQTSPDQVMFADLVQAQQTLAGFIAAYVTALGGQWQAVVDMANLLQTEDLAGTGPPQQVDPIPDLRKLLPPPGPVPIVPQKMLNGPKETCAADKELMGPPTPGE